MPIENTYGVITIFRDNQKDLFLLLQHKDKEGSWSFPKGHHERLETPRETALRELKEETGIKYINIIDAPMIHEEYEIIRNGENKIKSNNYFIGFVKNNDISIQKNEIHDYKWLTYEEAIKTFNYESRKDVLRKAKDFLKDYILLD